MNLREALPEFGDAIAGIGRGIGQLLLAVDHVGFDTGAKLSELTAAAPATPEMIGDLLTGAFRKLSIDVGEKLGLIQMQNRGRSRRAGGAEGPRREAGQGAGQALQESRPRLCVRTSPTHPGRGRTRIEGFAGH